MSALRLPWAMAIAAIALGYAGLCAWMYIKQRDLTYFPQFTRVAASETDFELRRNGVTLRGWLVNPGRDDAVLYFGGNAERIEMARSAFATWFAGRSVYLVAYRGYGASDGIPREAELFGDAVALFDHVRARHPGSIVVVGRSLGSGVASYLASQRPVARLALVTPFDSLASVASAHYPWLPVRWLFQERFYSARHLAGYAGPILVVRAGRDAVIPAANTDRLIATLARPPQVVAVAEADHNSLDAFPAYGQALTAFVSTQQSP